MNGLTLKLSPEFLEIIQQVRSLQNFTTTYTLARPSCPLIHTTKGMTPFIARTVLLGW